MSLQKEICQFCNKEPFKYTCPRCNKLYCCVDCYKSVTHLKCSEEFYKECINDDLASRGKESGRNKEDVQKMYDILRRMREFESGMTPENFDTLDSDDDDNGEYDDDGEDEDAYELDGEDEKSLVERLQNVDLDDADEVWKKLSPAERTEFTKLVDSGGIMKLIPNFQPWWIISKKSKIVELDANGKPSQHGASMPEIWHRIPALMAISSKEPSPCIHFNIWNIMAAYSSTVRYFAGEHLCNTSEAAAHLINLSQVLKYDTKFEDVEEAVVSVEIESLTTWNSIDKSVSSQESHTKYRDQLLSDAKDLMSSTSFKLAALSDIHNLFQMAKKSLKASKGKEAEFQKLFAFCSGSIELNPKKLSLLSKKMEYFLSYVNYKK